MRTLGKNIRHLRKLKNMKQGELATLIGKSKNVISNWERGDNRPDADTILLLCSILETSPNQIMNWNNDNYINEEKASYNTTDLTKEEEIKVLEYIEFIKSQRKN